MRETDDDARTTGGSEGIVSTRGYGSDTCVVTLVTLSSVDYQNNTGENNGDRRKMTSLCFSTGTISIIEALTYRTRSVRNVFGSCSEIHG